MLAWCKRGRNCLGKLSVCRTNNLKVVVNNICCAVAGMLTSMAVGMNGLMTEAVDCQVL